MLQRKKRKRKTASFGRCDCLFAPVSLYLAEIPPGGWGLGVVGVCVLGGLSAMHHVFTPDVRNGCEGLGLCLGPGLGYCCGLGATQLGCCTMMRFDATRCDELECDGMCWRESSAYSALSFALLLFCIPLCTSSTCLCSHALERVLVVVACLCAWRGRGRMWLKAVHLHGLQYAYTMLPWHLHSFCCIGANCKNALYDTKQTEKRKYKGLCTTPWIHHDTHEDSYFYSFTLRRRT